MPDESTADSNRFEWEFFVYEEPDCYSLWLQRGDRGVCLYNQTPEGEGMWLSPERDSNYEPLTPSDDLRHLLGRLVAQEDIEEDDVDKLDPHERNFFQIVHGTVSEKPDAIPDPVWTWMWDCNEEFVEA